jgi:hypothetical protein
MILGTEPRVRTMVELMERGSEIDRPLPSHAPSPVDSCAESYAVASESM